MNDSVTREAISRAEERKFLRFVKEDPHFCRYYEGIYILFKTGLRISEFCGLTISDIDFKEHTINIDHQLQKKSKIGYYIQETKTTSGTRKIPMTADVEECFRKIIEKRNPPKAEPMVDGKSGFLYFDKNESKMCIRDRYYPWLLLLLGVDCFCAIILWISDIQAFQPLIGLVVLTLSLIHIWSLRTIIR